MIFMKAVVVVGACLLMTRVSMGSDVCLWKGESFKSGWWCYQCKPTLTSEGWQLCSQGTDPFVTSPQFLIEKPSNAYEVVIRAKTTVSGRGELFYSRPGDRTAPQKLARAFQWIFRDIMGTGSIIQVINLENKLITVL